MSAKVIHFPSRPTRLSLRLDWFATDRSVLLGIWALYFALRAAVLMIDVAPTGPAAGYFRQAALIAAGTGSLVSPEGWPVVLGLVFAQFGASPVTLGLFNLACALMVGAMVLALGRRLFGSEGAARAGLLLLALCPAAIAQVPLALPHVLHAALLMAACWVIVTRTHRWQLVSAGLLLALATWLEPQTLAAVPLVFAVDWLRRGNLWRRLPGLLGDMLIALALAALPLLAWIGAATPIAAPAVIIDAYRAGAPGYAQFDAAYHAIALVDLCYSWLLAVAFAVTFLAMIARRRRDGQRWIGAWLLPYAIALYPVMASLAAGGHLRGLHAVIPWVCMTAGWLGITALGRLGERRMPKHTLH